MRTYVLGPLPDERLIWMEGRGADRQVSYPHTDRRGSTIALSRGGQAVTTYAYDEYGQGRAQDGVTGYPFRYTGQRLDPWTGTYHYKAREYSPQLGRFLQPDPARFVDGPNVYAYVGNNPWNLVDPAGMNGLNLFNGSQPDFYNVGRWLERADTRNFYISAHASNAAIQDQRRTRNPGPDQVWDANELADYLTNPANDSGWAAGQEIWLLACELGADTFASELADRLNVVVWAPDGFVEFTGPLGVRDESTLTVGSTGPNNTREGDSVWRAWGPDGQEIPGAVVRQILVERGERPVLTDRQWVPPATGTRIRRD